MQNIDSMKIPYKIKAKVLEINKKVYEKYADIVVDEKNLNIEETLQKIIEKLKK